MVPFSIKNGKTEQTESEADFGLRLFGPGALPSEKKLTAFGRLFAEHVAPRSLLDALGSQRGLQNCIFLALHLEQISKKSFQVGFQKKLEKLIEKH